MRLGVVAAWLVVAMARPALAQPAPPPTPPATPTGDPLVEPDAADAAATAPPIAADAPQPEGGIPPDPVPVAGDGPGADFGPLLVIDAIEVVGNRSTAARVIRRALPVAIGDVLRAGDPRLASARFKVLALGFFRDVKLSLHRGAARGHVHLVVEVVERGTVVLNRLWFGASASSTYWLGADLDERNLLGTGLAVGGGAVFAGRGAIVGSRDQYAGELRLADAEVGATRFGAYGALTWIHASEPFRVGGDPSDDAASDFRAFSYRRVGGRANLTYNLTALTRVSAGARVELVDAALPVAPTRALPDGRIAAIDLGLEPGRSRVVTLSFGVDRDTRPDPALPHDGGHGTFNAELGSRFLGGSYDYASLLGRWDRWWPLRHDRTIGLRLTGGAVIGRAPRFDRIHVADVDRLLTPRALGLVVSTNSSDDILHTGTSDVVYGDAGGSAVVELAMQLFRRQAHVYGGDLFVGAGLWALADVHDLQVRDRPLWQALPVDVIADAGLRIDTEIGIFELTIANTLGEAAAVSASARALVAAATIAILALAPGRAAADDGDDDAPELQRMRFAERGDSLVVTANITKIFDSAAYEALENGLSSTVVIRLWVYRTGTIEPVAFQLLQRRVVYDLWDEVYVVRLDGPGGRRTTKVKYRAEALKLVTSLDAVPIARLADIPYDAHHVLAIEAELNPVSAATLAEVRRWLTQSTGGGLDRGGSLFGSFVSVFVNPKISAADRVIRVQSDRAFYRQKPPAP